MSMVIATFESGYEAEKVRILKDPATVQGTVTATAQGTVTAAAQDTVTATVRDGKDEDVGT